ELGHAFSGAFVVFDALELAHKQGMDELAVNAILLGALAASGALPINADAYQGAIRDTGIGVEPNLAAYRVGYEFAARGGHLTAREKHSLSVAELVQLNAAKLRSPQQERYVALAARATQEYAEDLHEVLVEALFQLTDYQ